MRREADEAAFREYLTRSVTLAVEGKVMSKGLHEVIRPHSEDGRTAEQIAADVICGAGLEIIEE